MAQFGSSELSSQLGPAFRLVGVTKSYAGRRALGPLDLAIDRGERVALIGPSGSGKTTLLRLLSGLAWPDEGRVESLGRDTKKLAGRALRELRRDVGVLLQNDNLVGGLRVAHNVLMGRLGHWSPLRAFFSLISPRELDRARAALDQVELADRLWALPGELSGGQQQRVAIARLLVQNPSAWLADEPTASLDVRLGREVLELFARAAAERGATLIASLHALNLLEAHFQRVVALRGGKVYWDGRPKDLDRSLLQEIYGEQYDRVRVEESVA